MTQSPSEQRFKGKKMPRITDIQVQKNNKNRVNIYVDGEFLRGAEAISVVRNGLKTGMEISEERLREALSDSERESAFAKAVEYLSRAMRTEEQLKKFLSSKGYDSDTVDSVADKLREYGYIDDARYARLYAEQFGKTRGQRRIVNELRQKGVLTEIAMRFGSQEDGYARDNANAVADKFMKNKPNDTATLVRLQRHLLSRGYDYDTVSVVINRYRDQQQ